MSSKFLSLIVGFSVLLVAPVDSSQILKRRVLLERKSIKVAVANTFPKDLSCQVYLGSFDHSKNVLGSKDSPIFEAEGKKGRIELAHLHIGSKSTITAVRKDTDEDSYLWHLLLEDEDGKIFSLIDLNLDGEWDVKKTLKPKRFIRVANEWIEVDKIDGLHSKKPIAAQRRKKFVFQKKWTPIK